MYVANASLQRHLFSYRLPEEPKTRTITIESMGQALIPDDLRPDDVSAIMSQHKIYGFLNVDELRSAKLRERTTLMYSLGKPISSLAIDSLFNMNRGIMDEFGRRIRQETAVVANQAVNNALDEQRRQGLQADVRQFEMSVVEEEPAGGYTTPKPVAEGFRVQPDAPKNPPRASRNRRG